MCGILCICGSTSLNALKSLETLEKRGPEGTILQKLNNVTMGFTRLAINGLTYRGMQPFSYKDMMVVCNGEIYNHRDLAKEYSIDIGGSDCEILLPLFEKLNKDIYALARSLDGVFAIVIYDGTSLYIARDPYGVRPLYYGKDAKTFCVASEIKALIGCTDIKPFPSGYVATYKNHELVLTKYHSIPYLKNPNYSMIGVAADGVRRALDVAVRKRMMTDRPIAALLSGGLDSSLIAALVQQELLIKNKRLETFSIGFEGSPDLKYARIVADYIGSKHHEIVCTPQQFFDAIPFVIRDIECCDITTVRASVGNWLVAKAIKERSDCKVVFNGDGSDEVFGSYLYFQNAPNDMAFELECDRLLKDIHHFDVLRSDRCISSHGLEPRTPFLDKAFVAVAKSVPTKFRKEKLVLRKAFEERVLPPQVLWRKKEAFSDGVSSESKSWFTEIQERVSPLAPPDSVLELMYPHLTPRTPEAVYYRELYEHHYGVPITPYFWMPKWTNATDPSARTLAIY